MYWYVISAIVIGVLLSVAATDSQNSTKPRHKPKQKRKTKPTPIQKRTTPVKREIRERPQTVKVIQHVDIDITKLAELKQQTKIAHELLSEIFAEDIQEEKTPPKSYHDELVGLIKILMQKEVWKRSEIQSVCGPNVMVGNLLEQINDYSYSIVGDAVVEDMEDEILVMIQYKNELMK